MCQKIDRKRRRYEKASSDYKRWYYDQERQASACKAGEDMRVLAHEINELTKERESKMKAGLCNGRRIH